MIWLAWLRIAPLAGCKVVPEAFDPRLECAAFASDQESAEQSIEQALKRDRYGIESVESMIAFDPDAWNDENDPGAAIRMAARTAGELRKPVFASFARSPEA